MEGDSCSGKMKQVIRSYEHLTMKITGDEVILISWISIILVNQKNKIISLFTLLTSAVNEFLAKQIFVLYHSLLTPLIWVFVIISCS